MVGNEEIAYLAGGCFWCTEAVYRQVDGVKSVDSGYSGGHVDNPSYELVCTGTTGHAETVKIVFDPSSISYAEILEIFFATHDPTTLNRQGHDTGTQYRSAIFYVNQNQKEIAVETVNKLNSTGKYRGSIVTEITPFTSFYSSEDYHKNYFENNPDVQYCRFVIKPKVQKFRKEHDLILKRET